MSHLPLLHQEQNKPRPTLTLDVSLYEHYLDDANLTDEEKTELLQTLWTIITQFVYLGFGVDSVQHIRQEGCGKGEHSSTKPSTVTGDSLDSIKKNRGKANHLFNSHTKQSSQLEEGRNA